MERDEELHDELMKAFREYFKANQDWVQKGTRRAGMDTRRWLNEIRHICSKRRKVIMDWRYDLNEKTALKKAQNQQAPKDDNAN